MTLIDIKAIVLAIATPNLGKVRDNSIEVKPALEPVEETEISTPAGTDQGWTGIAPVSEPMTDDALVFEPVAGEPGGFTPTVTDAVDPTTDAAGAVTAVPDMSIDAEAGFVPVAAMPSPMVFDLFQ